MRSFVLGLFAVCFLILVSGCQTVAHTSEGFGRGVSEDISGSSFSLVKMNKWIEEHWW
jgi:uncharacterized protein YceK